MLIPGIHAQSAEPAKRPKTAPEVWLRTELYFGTNRGNASPVSEPEFNSFLDSEVTPRFMDGLTVLTAYGQFRNSEGETVREKSYLVILFYSRQMPDANRRIQEIREAYKHRFSQESVLRADSASIISF